MKTLFLFDLHTVRQDPYAMERWDNEIFSTLKNFQKTQSVWNGIQPFQLLTKHELSNSCPWCISLPNTVRCELMKFMMRWDDDAVSLWCDLMKGKGKIAELYCDILQWLVNKYGIECFAYWGSNHTIKNFCDSSGIYSIAMEQGPTRVPFLETRYCDFAGVNGDSHSSMIDISRVPEMDTESWLQKRGLYFSQSGMRRDSIFTPITSRFSSEIYRADSPCVLIVMQLDDDSNCLIHSDYSGMEQMVREVAPSFLDAGWTVFIKPHPGAAPERNQGRARWKNVLAHEACRKFAGDNNTQGKKIFWLDDIIPQQYPSLLSKMDVILSVNSSVGFEAMLIGKIVVSLGRSPYNIQQQLPTIEQILNGSFDFPKYDSYRKRVCNFMLNYYLQSGNLLSDPAKLSASVLRNMALTDRYAYDNIEDFTDFILKNPICLHTELQ